MTICKILAPVLGVPSDEGTLAAAIHFAKLSNAHVQALFVLPDPSEAPPFTGVPLTADALAAVLRNEAELAVLRERYARRTVAEVCAAAGAVQVDRPEKSDQVTVSFRCELGSVRHVLAREAALSDLVTFGAVEQAGTWDLNSALLAVLLSVHQPILVAPNRPTRMRRIAIGWDGSAISARSVREAIPFLRCAETVDVVTVQNGDRYMKDGQIAWYLARSQVFAKTRIIERTSHSVGETLLQDAIERGCDLIVLGGYGHDHVREALFGGVTRTFLRQASIAVLLTH